MSSEPPTERVSVARIAVLALAVLFVASVALGRLSGGERPRNGSLPTSSLSHTAPSQQNCIYSEWSAPIQVAIPFGSFVRWPSIAVSATEAYVVGNDIPWLDESLFRPRPLLALSLPERILGPPGGNFTFAFPKAVVDSRDVLHVIWSEPDSIAPRTGSDWVELSGTQGSIWYASFSNNVWTKPSQLYRGVDLQWSDVQADVKIDNVDRLHVAVVDDRVTSSVLLYMTREGTAWRQTRIPVHGAVYSSIAVGSEGEVYIAYIGPDTTMLPDANSVFVTRSFDAGNTWSSPQLISRSGERQAFEVKVISTPDGVIHLVWAQNLSGGIQAAVIRHIFLISPNERYQLWSFPHDLDVEDGFFGLQAISDACGSIHVLYSTWTVHDSSSDPDDYVNELWYMYKDSAWSIPTRLFPHLNSLQPAIGSSPTAPGVQLFWSARPIESIGREPFRPQMSRRSFQVGRLAPVLTNVDPSS